jgi:hypothetical protein
VRSSSLFNAGLRDLSNACTASNSATSQADARRLASYPDHQPDLLRVFAVANVLPKVLN